MSDRIVSPSEHLREAQRLARAAESAGVDSEVATVAALLSIAHALLCAAPRRARRPERAPASTNHGNSPRERWLRGEAGNE